MSNIDEAMTAARARMTMAEEAFALAKPYEIGNHLSEALAIAQAGLPTGKCRYALASWTSELAEGLGNREHWMLVFSPSSFALVFRVSTGRTSAANQWDGIKPDLLQTSVSGMGSQGSKGGYFFSEGLLDDAIQAVRSDSYYHFELVHRVMQAAVSTHPIGWLKRLSNGQN